MTPSSPSQVSGYAAAWSIVFVWSFWLIVSRVANQSGLTIYDLAAMRYGLASLVAVPLCLYYKPWRGMALVQIAILSFILGPVYILSVFNGFVYAPASHGGIFMNGILPLVGIVIGIVLLRKNPTPRQIVGAALILVSAVVLAWDGTTTTTETAWIGDILLSSARYFSRSTSFSQNDGSLARCRSSFAAPWLMPRFICQSGRSGCRQGWPRHRWGHCCCKRYTKVSCPT